MSENSTVLPTKTHRSLWPYGIAFVLSLSIVVNLWMVKIAVSHPSVPTSADHWQKSLDFERELQAQKIGKFLGWQVDVGSCIWKQGQCTLRLKIVDETNAPVEGLQGNAELWRADSSTFDRQIAFEDVGGGNYSALLVFPSSGHYLASLSLFSDGAMWRTQRPIALYSQLP